MGHIHATEALLAVIRPPQYSMNHHGSGYSDHIIDFIIFHPILLVTSHSNVIDAVSLSMQISGEILGGVDTIIW